MQSRGVALEEGKERTNQSKGLPLRPLRLLVLFLALCVVFSVITIYTVKHFGIESVVTTMSSSFQPCYEEPGGLDKWIRPPSNPIHNMSDKELLWRASFVPRIKDYPYQRVPKIAFMFLTKGPMPLAPLWERFLKGHENLYSIYIHSLPSYQPQFPPSSVFYNRQIPSQVWPYQCYAAICWWNCICSFFPSRHPLDLVLLMLNCCLFKTTFMLFIYSRVIFTNCLLLVLVTPCFNVFMRIQLLLLVACIVGSYFLNTVHVDFLNGFTLLVHQVAIFLGKKLRRGWWGHAKDAGLPCSEFGFLIGLNQEV